MKIKVSDATTVQLDWMVAKCKGWEPFWNEAAETFFFNGLCPLCFLTEFHPSTNWSQGGPIIEREHIIVEWWNEEHEWRASIADDFEQFGDTFLIAAMRCYVASKLGDEVEIPEELK